MTDDTASPRPTPGWLIDEVASAGRENLDVDHVARYDAKEDADAEAELSLLRGLGLDGRSQLVDLGAGTGQFTLAAAGACTRVVAVDVSPVMIERLRAKIAEAGHANIEVVRAGFLTYVHRGEPVDFAYSRLALHHLPDFWKALALARVRRILRPGGVFRLWDVAFDFDPEEAGARVEAWCAQGGDHVEGEWSRAEFEEHVRDEHSTFRWLLEPMIERCGFEIEDAAYSEDGFFGAYVLRAT